MSAPFSIASASVSPADKSLLERIDWMKAFHAGSVPASEPHSSVSIQHFSPDHEIYSEGENGGSFFRVLKGVVRTCKFLSDGRRQIDAFYVEGDLFGFEFGGEHAFSAEAVCECSVIVYRRDNNDILKSDVPTQELFNYAMRNLERAQEHSLLLGRKTAFEKVAAFLVDWAQQSAAREDINLAMTRHDIADYLGLTLETVSRTLSQLERTGLIELTTARHIRLKNKASLQEINA